MGTPHKNQMEQAAERVGLYVATWAPGDGATRYRFFAEPTDYHGGDGLYTALGRKEAYVFLRGVSVGRALKKEG